MFIYIFSESLDVNDALMELFIVAYACRTACAKRIIGKEYIYSIHLYKCDIYFFNLVGVKKMNFRLNEFKACHSV